MSTTRRAASNFRRVDRAAHSRQSSIASVERVPKDIDQRDDAHRRFIAGSLGSDRSASRRFEQRMATLAKPETRPELRHLANRCPASDRRRTIGIDTTCRYARLRSPFRSSSVVERSAVNRLVVGSSPSSGARDSNSWAAARGETHWAGVCELERSDSMLAAALRFACKRHCSAQWSNCGARDRPLVRSSARQLRAPPTVRRCYVAQPRIRMQLRILGNRCIRTRRDEARVVMNVNATLTVC
jgi:hypothetical protein